MQQKLDKLCSPVHLDCLILPVHCQTILGDLVVVMALSVCVVGVVLFSTSGIHLQGNTKSSCCTKKLDIHTDQELFYIFMWVMDTSMGVILIRGNTCSLTMRVKNSEHFKLENSSLILLLSNTRTLLYHWVGFK